MVYGLWFMVYGLWFMVYGLWFMVYGLWFMVYGAKVSHTPRTLVRSNYLCVVRACGVWVWGYTTCVVVAVVAQASE
jgi:hypothetical protein